MHQPIVHTPTHMLHVIVYQDGVSLCSQGRQEQWCFEELEQLVSDTAPVQWC